MIPILYRGDEQTFLHNGLGQLTEATSAIVTEVANGKFELELTYPVSGRLKNSISDHMLIKAKPNSVDEPHVFRIYNHTIDTETKTINISAHSKSNDLGNNLVKKVKVTNSTPQQAMSMMKSNLVEPTEYDFISDITTKSSTEWINRNPLNCIAGESGSLIHYWGGEIKRDNRTIYLYRRRGNDNVAIIREGRDLGGLSIEYSTKGMVTKIIPFRTYTPEDAEEEITEYGTPVESKYVGNYPIKYIMAVDYSNEDDVTNLQTMNAKASKYFTENNGIDKPNINVNVNLVDLSESPEYEKFKNLENKQLFDTLTVYSKTYDINIEAKVNTLVYDSLGEKNISLDMGSYKTGLMESTDRTYKDLLTEREAQITNVIQRAANGKNRIYRGVDEPTKGMVKNDLWYQPVGDGETMLYRFDGAYWDLEKVSAGLLGGTLDAENGDVDLINVNVSTLVGGISEFIQSYWNGINSQIHIDGLAGELVANDSDGNMAIVNTNGEFRSFSSSDNTRGIFHRGRIWFYNEDGSAVLNIGAHQVNGMPGFRKGVLATARAQPLIIGRYDDYLITNPNAKVNPYISLEYEATPGDESRAFVKLWRDVSMYGKGIKDIQYLSGYELSVRSTDGRLMLGVLAPDKTPYNTLEVGYANTRSNGNFELMPGYEVINNSDRRIKKEIVDTEVEGRPLIRQLEFKDFKLIDGPEDLQFGLIAQDSPLIGYEGEDGLWRINTSKQIMLTSLAAKELDKDLEQTKKELDETKQELSDLKKLLKEKGLI